MNRHSVRRGALVGAIALGFVTGVYAAGEAAPPVPAAAYARRATTPRSISCRTGVASGRSRFRRPGTKRETPTLKGKYLADYPGVAEGRRRRTAAWRRRRPPTARRRACRTSWAWRSTRSSSCSRRAASPRITRRGCSGGSSTRMAGRMRTSSPASTATPSGKWEGDTLVVDTVNIKTTVPLGPGMFHSDKVHVVERYSPGSEECRRDARADHRG